MRAQDRPNSSIVRGTEHETTLLAEKLLVIGSCWDMKSQFSLVKNCLVRQLHSTGSPHIQGYLESTN